MAESVVTSVASSVISSAINSLATLVWDEINSPRDVRNKVQLIEAKLGAIQSYLKDAENKPQRNHLTKSWLNEIMRVTHQAQDVIEKYFWLQRRRNRARGFTGVFSRYFHIPGYLKSLHDIEAEIDRINRIIPEISDLINNLSGVNLGESSTMADQFGDEEFQDPRTTIHVNDEDEVVGFDEEIKEIITELLDPTYQPLCAVSLVGMGGIGKTTLAKNVLNHSHVKGHFNIIASIIVSQQYNVLNLQKEILKAAIKPEIKKEDLEKMDEKEVRKRLDDSLKEKKYLIVIDDIWTIRSWDEINPQNKTFPDMNNGSRIMLTTRNSDVAKCPNFRYFVHEVKLLDDEKSWKLLKRKAFPSYAIVSNEIKNELESLHPQLVRKCKGLPLALIVLGGYLSKHLDYQTWSRMAKAVDWSEAGDRINILEILALSYHDLPNYLKEAFLYITAFPEDHIIESSDLIRLWIAEGFIPPNQKYQMEIRARIYLDQLYERCLIRVVERSKVHGWISLLMMHDVLRDWGMRKAKEDGFFDVINGSVNSYRVALHDGYCNEDIATSMPNLRTMLVFNGSVNSFRGLKSLRAVTFINCVRANIFVKHTKNMIFLRHICLRKCGRVYFPSSIGELSNLQTLDCQADIMSVPSSLWEISTLRHVHLDSIHCNWNGPKKGSGKNLQTLFVMQDNPGLLEKTMAWMYTGVDELVAAVEEMEQIVNLELLVLGNLRLPRNLLSKILCLRNLEVLRLTQIEGLTRIPAAIAFPPNIVSIRLTCVELVEDPMPVLEKLPKLVELSLCFSHHLISMHCSPNGFPRLKYLTLLFFFGLKDWEVGVGAMPCLCELELNFFLNLKKFPEKLMEHDQLKEVRMFVVPHLSELDYSKLEEKGCKVDISGDDYFKRLSQMKLHQLIPLRTRTCLS
jgi:uridine kinase